MSFDPYQQPKSPLEQPPAAAGKPGVSLGLGLFGLVAWILPIVGLPVTIVGLVLGVNALSGRRRGTALAGVILCSLGLILAGLNMAVGAYLGATGQHPLVNQLRGQQRPGPCPGGTRRDGFARAPEEAGRTRRLRPDPRLPNRPEGTPWKTPRERPAAASGPCY